MTSRGEAGAAALLTLLLAALGLGIGSIILGATVDVAAAAARARTAADAAALAAAATSPLVSGAAGSLNDADQARVAAERVARANGARLQRIDTDGWPLRIAVRVAVAPRTQLARSVVGMSEAGAVAGVRPSDRNPRAAALPWY